MKFKKRIAVLLAATMVLGSTVTVMAYPVPDSGSATGTGTSEGHLNREIGNVVLPTTVSENAFSYTIDPERLVSETNGAKHSGATFAGTSKADGVFFQTADNTYDSKTNEYEVVNKSTFPIDVTIKVAAPAEAAATDIALVSANALTGATTPGLYLGLKVGATPSSETAVPVLFGTPAEKTLSVNAVKNNFEASVSNNAYVYQEKANVADNTWQRTKFLLEGKTTNGADGAEGLQIASNTTAPTLTVTWSWKKYGASSITVTPSSMSTAAKSATISGVDGLTLTKAEVVKKDASKVTLTSGTQYTYSNKVFSIPSGKEALLNSATYAKFVLTYSDGTTVDIPIVAP